MSKMSKNGIYAIVNQTNGKLYIGSTAKTFKQRKYQHFYDLRNNKHHNQYLQSAWNKYGEPNFTFQIIETIDNFDTIAIREQHWIDFYKTYAKDGNGYNLLQFVDGHNMHSAETKKKLSKLHTPKNHPMHGRNHSDASKKQISDSRIGKYGGKNCPSYGKPCPDHVKQATIKSNKNRVGETHTEEHKLKIANSCQGKNAGSNHGLATFTEELVLEIRTKHEKGGVTQKELAQEFNTTINQIGKIVRYERWKHIGNPSVHLNKVLERNKKLKFSGTKSPNSKLQDSDVKEIRRLYSNKEMSLMKMAKHFNVSIATIKNIVYGRSWKHLL